MQETPRGTRLHIAIFGRRNAGKSSLINAITNQEIALVSDVPGTTTDPVYKSMEILPLGPVVIIDTAGIDDTGVLGELRVERTWQVLNKTDLAVLVVDLGSEIDAYEEELVEKIKERKIPLLGAANKLDHGIDLSAAKEKIARWQEKLGIPFVAVSARTGKGIDELKMEMIKLAPADWIGETILGDIIKPGDVVVLVVPIDTAAPKGRLILPQVQTLRDILDHAASAVVVKENGLKDALDRLVEPPQLVVTDSQAFKAVAAVTPREVPLTSFSILFARYKGDLPTLVEGARSIERLKPGDRVLIAEGCTHHRQADDIGKVKIPRWLEAKVGGSLNFAWVSGTGYPRDLREYKLIVHCGACMLNRKEMLYRIAQAKHAGIPIVNYGVLIAYLNGILDRVLEPLS